MSLLLKGLPAIIRIFASPYHTALGHFTAIWAGLEMSMDSLNAIIIRHAGGHIIEADLPVALKRKISLIRKAHSQLEELAPWRETGIALADRVAAMREQRHDMIHGWPERRGREDRTTKINRYILSGAGFAREVRYYTVIDVLRLTEAAGRLAGDINQHALLLGGTLAPGIYGGPDHSEDLRG